MMHLGLWRIPMFDPEATKESQSWDKPFEAVFRYYTIGFRTMFNPSKQELEFQYWCFGEWRTYYTMTAISRRHLQWLSPNSLEHHMFANALAKAQQEMRYYKVERVSETAKIGQVNR